MSSYCTVDQFTRWTSHIADQLDIPEDVQALLDRASADIDAHLCVPLPPDPPPPADPDDPLEPLPSTRLDPAKLSRWEAWVLSKACAEQSVYRLIQGEDEIAEGTSRIASIGGGGQSVTFSRDKLDLLGPQTFVSLVSAPNLWKFRTGTVPPDDPAAA